MVSGITQKGFFDTGIFILASYAFNINYNKLTSEIIDPRCGACFELFERTEEIVICSGVKHELVNMKERRRIQHEILFFQLSDPSSGELQDLWFELANGRSASATRRDREWLNEIIADLKKYELKEIFQDVHELRLRFEMNMDELRSKVEVFYPTEKQKIVRNEIRNIIDEFEKMPNCEDVVIFANSIVYHNHESEVILYTTDKGFLHFQIPQTEILKHPQVGSYVPIQVI